jgi:hypothetical protein
MTKRNRHKRKPHQAEQAAREQTILNAPADTSNQAVQALMSPEFERMSNMNAAEIALMLQQIVRGELSLLAEQNTVQIAKIKERQDQIDQRIADELASNRKFIEEVLDRAESLRRTGEAQDKLIAQGMAQYQAAKQHAVADLAAKNIAFRQRLTKERKVTVVSPGQLVTTMEHGRQVSRIIPEEIHVKDIHMRLPVGQPVELPETLATILADRRRSGEETARRAQLLEKNLEVTKLAEEWNKIEGSKADPMPL